MGQNTQRSYAWYDDDDSLEEQVPTKPGMAGLPEHWRHYEWKLAAMVFAVLWLIETWTAGTPLMGIKSANHIAQGIWGLLVTLTVCAGLFHFWTRRRPSVGFSLCILIAFGALMSHTL